MCESVVFLKEGSGMSALMTDAIEVRHRGAETVCTNIAGETVALTDVILAEIDLLRHRIIFQRA